MSKYYGTLQGCRGTATRCGSKDSGIRASAQSWEGSVTVALFENGGGDLRCQLTIDKNGSSTSGECVFHGSIEELYERLK